MGGAIAAIIILALIIWVVLSCIKIVPQAQAYVVERLGEITKFFKKFIIIEKTGGIRNVRVDS